MKKAAGKSADILSLFRAGGLRATEARVTVLKILVAADRALSHNEIEQTVHKQGSDIERVTLYRVLDWLVKQRLAHKITGRDRIWRFGAQADPNSDHAHFSCTRCGRVFCLESLVPTVALTLPTGFQLQHADLSVQGVCPRCRH